MKWMYKIQKFMIGRYGPDDLYHFLFKFYIFLILIDLFINFRLLGMLELIVAIIMLYRFFSKNKKKRRKENNWYLDVKKEVLKPFKNIKRNYQDRKLYVYKKCHKCKTTLKLPLPSKRGVQHVKCPKCKNKMTFLCFRKEKIEVIKNKRRK